MLLVMTVAGLAQVYSSGRWTGWSVGSESLPLKLRSMMKLMMMLLDPLVVSRSRRPVGGCLAPHGRSGRIGPDRVDSSQLQAGS